MIENSISGLKEKIEKALNELQLDEAYALIKEYDRTAPMNIDLVSYYCAYYMYLGDYSKSLEYAMSGISRYPTSADMSYNLASAYEMLGDIGRALIYYIRSYNLNTLLYLKDELDPDSTEYNTDTVTELEYRESHIRELLAGLKSVYMGSNDESVESGIRLFIQLPKEEYVYTINNTRLIVTDPIIGDYYTINLSDRLYIADYRMQSAYGLVADDRYNAMEMAIEMRQVNEGTECSIPEDISGTEYLIPIAAKEEYTSHEFRMKEDSVRVLQQNKHHFNYFRLPQGSSVRSDGISYYGNPIRLGHSPDRKRLVLSIFVDGLSQSVLNDMQNIMPHTWKYFSNGGLICTNAHSTGEWTLPSIASINSGLYTPAHMVFHPDADSQMPYDITTLSEYFQDAGYYTSRITGDWRISPNYGYARGVDQFLFRNQNCGFRLDEIMGIAIDHLYAFAETDQFLSLDMNDLHNVADYFDLPLSAQTRLPVGMRAEEYVDDTSVKLNYSEPKKYAYELMIKSVDTQLQTLYNYVEENYDQEDVVVSLFSDHGQGYLIPNDKFFMSPERTNVAFMIKGGHEFDNRFSDELISGVDYVPIMTSLTGIGSRDENIDGRLPRFMGGSGHEYIINESIHPGDPYRAALYTDEYMVHFENPVPVGHDGCFRLNDYTVTIYDRYGRKTKDTELERHFADIIKEHIAGLIIY